MRWLYAIGWVIFTFTGIWRDLAGASLLAAAPAYETAALFMSLVGLLYLWRIVRDAL